MVKKKKHHYIPRFYLKRFSINNGGKFLGLYNLNNKKFIPNAALKNQAYGNFLYGEDDEIENALAHIEGNVAKMFYYWTEEKVLIPPPIESNGFKLIKRFMLYQAFRTPNSGENIMESLNKGLKAFVKEFKPELWESLKDATLQHENPVLLGLLHSIEHEKLLDYLDFRFIVNLSLLPFITSDSPIIFYNQLMEQAGNYIGATGLVAKGLQIFYPIHPRLMICLYDPEVYDLGDDVNCCSTESIDTIHQLNGLQFINCESQIYFNNFISEEYTHELSNNFQEYRGTKRNINEIINQNNKKFFFISSEDIQIRLQLDFLKIKVNLNHFKNGINPLRHPSFSIR
ncbi:DUF4238 domain-containing protein [Chryseobacterium indologenes]|uniref:DUF4238 domain-containing protein n=1 Tax=Chryseobacterium indologenes TaxID=253 RepID=A0A0N0ZSW6_CHRID|nr:DUF4238 domain-containing protein [Chryseobacterium indologenes]KPE49648.1 hypothetical protein AOB46_19205 [Chryseobacterium indologenes]